jgi:hypothetical protein
MELHEALGQISVIRRQMARGEVFRGYRALSVAASGVTALVAAALQPFFITDPTNQLGIYLAWWIVIAAIGATLAGVEMIWRSLQSPSAFHRQMTLLATEQFLPCLLVGGLLTACLARSAPETAWMLPGLWSLIFSLGVFASFRVLPREIFFVGVYYAACGGIHLFAGDGPHALAPWRMALSFGGGQLLAAIILYWKLERKNVIQP